MLQLRPLLLGLQDSLRVGEIYIYIQIFFLIYLDYLQQGEHIGLQCHPIIRFFIFFPFPYITCIEPPGFTAQKPFTYSLENFSSEVLSMLFFKKKMGESKSQREIELEKESDIYIYIYLSRQFLKVPTPRICSSQISDILDRVRSTQLGHPPNSNKNRNSKLNLSLQI